MNEDIIIAKNGQKSNISVCFVKKSPLKKTNYQIRRGVRGPIFISAHGLSLIHRIRSDETKNQISVVISGAVCIRYASLCGGTLNLIENSSESNSSHT